MLMNIIDSVVEKRLENKPITLEEQVQFGLACKKLGLPAMFKEFNDNIRENGENVCTDIGYVDVTKPMNVTLDWKVFCKVHKESADKAMDARLKAVEAEGLTFSQLTNILTPEWRKEHGIRSKLDVTRDQYAKQVESTPRVEFHPY